MSESILICAHIDGREKDDLSIGEAKYDFRAKKFIWDLGEPIASWKIIGWSEINYPTFNI